MNTILTLEDIKWLLKSSAAVPSTMVQSISGEKGKVQIWLHSLNSNLSTPEFSEY